MVALLLDDRLDDFLGRYRRGYGPQPTGILSPNRFVKVQRLGGQGKRTPPFLRVNPIPPFLRVDPLFANGTQILSSSDILK